MKVIIRTRDDMVMVFDGSGEQMPGYQGSYHEVREKIIRRAPADAVFAHWYGQAPEPDIVTRETW